MMRDKDYEFLLESWKTLASQLQDVNASLRELVEAQQKTILKLQGIQVPDEILKGV
jgi:uncharacterized protein YhbP (UPF0306 family)